MKMIKKNCYQKGFLKIGSVYSVFFILNVSFQNQFLTKFQKVLKMFN